MATALYCLAALPVNGGRQADQTPSALTFEAPDGHAFATRGVYHGVRLVAAEIPDNLKKAIVAIEDRRFYKHFGVDPHSLMRALWRDVSTGTSAEGASTITQQLARLTFLSPERSIRRKIQEALIALWLESHLTKDEILVRYLNTAYFGASAYGADAAAKRYFGKSAKELSLAEAAMLAGLVRSPTQLSPTRNFGGARERANLVINAMAETGLITQKQADDAANQPITLKVPSESSPGANYFVDAASAETRRLVGSGPTDLIVITTLNTDLQSIAESIVRKRLDGEGKAKNVTQAALVALAPDGAVVAMLGGRDYDTSQFNRALQAKRQTGSLFKIFVYLTALRRGASPESMVVDRPVEVGDWAPRNASGRYEGPISLEAAFARSINSVAVQLAQSVGIDAVIQTARELGIESPLPQVPSLALGTADVTLFEMTRAFGSLATGRVPFEPYMVKTIRVGAEQPIYMRPASASGADLGEVRQTMRKLLGAVVTEGTGQQARIEGIDVFGKTGTTQSYKDAWFIGFTDDLIVGVWVGNDDGSPMDNVAGGDLPASIWRDFVSKAEPILKKPAGAAARPAPTSAAVNPAPLAGSAEVIDTGTLQVEGKTVRLAGVEGQPGAMAQRLARFLRGRKLVCEPQGGGDTYQCLLQGYDLSQIILGAGGAAAKPDADPRLIAAEETARATHRGIWSGRY
jgi:1A family penicillin-binding protein